MTQITPLDAALAAVNAAPDDDAARLRFLGDLVAAELFVLLEKEPADASETISPRLAETAEGSFVLAFDTEERLADFAGQSAAYAALSGRMLAQMLNGQGLGLALNPHLVEAAFFLDPDGVGWLAGLSAQAPREMSAQIAGIGAPTGLPESLRATLRARLAAASGLATSAALAQVAYADGRSGHVLGIFGAAPEAEAALAQAVQGALSFSGLDTGEIDVAFLAEDDPLASGLLRHGLRFDIPAPPAPAPRAAPGSDPDTPPILR